MSPLAASLRIAHAELLSSLRDRMTMVYAVLLPLALYPVLLFVVVQVFLVVRGREQHALVRVGVVEPADVAPADRQRLEDAMRGGPNAAATPGARPLEPVEVLAARQGGEDAARAWLAEDDGPDAVLCGPRAEGALLVHDSTRGKGELAVRRLLPRLERLAEDLRQAGARDAGLGADALDALVVEARRDLAPQEDKAAFLLSFLLPMLMVMMTLSGAFYPAIDATAGERERGTHDTTLLLPVTRSTVLQGKILAVAALAMLATLLNVLAMGLSVGHLLGMLKGGGADLQFEVPWTAFVAIAPLALLFAFFVAATMMVFASRAKTFKEGQAALGPLQLFFYLPAMAGALPGLALTPALACVPVVNVVLAFRDLLKGRVAPLEYALAAVSLLVLALLAVRGATWFLQREEGGRPWFALRGGKAA
jgi:ABC-type Na+ efflux pump permease subunit